VHGWIRCDVVVTVAFTYTLMASRKLEGGMRIWMVWYVDSSMKDIHLFILLARSESAIG
jgi:hypothetical protein